MTGSATLLELSAVCRQFVSRLLPQFWAKSDNPISQTRQQQYKLLHWAFPWNRWHSSGAAERPKPCKALSKL